MRLTSIVSPKASPPPVANDPRWLRIVARDKSADGHLWYSVVTTGVYCRASCPSRIANPENVQLHDTLPSARATGFRACKRCKPDAASLASDTASLIAKACRIIETSEQEPPLAQLAGAIGRSASHFHRLFKAATGLTPKDYASATRANKIRQGLVAGAAVTKVIYDAGFNSSGRFYANATDMLGMTPSHYRAGGPNEEIKFAVGQTSLGAILVASSRKGVAAILLGDDPDALVRDLQDRFAQARLIGANRAYEALVARVVGLVEAPNLGLNLPLDVRGTAFQHRVWRALRSRPFPMPASRSGSARRGRPGRSPLPALPTILPLPFPATACCARTVRSRVMPGASSAAASCWSGKPRARRARSRCAPSAPVSEGNEHFRREVETSDGVYRPRDILRGAACRIYLQRLRP